MTSDTVRKLVPWQGCFGQWHDWNSFLGGSYDDAQVCRICPFHECFAETSGTHIICRRCYQVDYLASGKLQIIRLSENKITLFIGRGYFGASRSAELNLCLPV